MTEALGEDVQEERGCKGSQGNGDFADAGWVLQPSRMAKLGVLLAGAEAGWGFTPQQLLGYDPDV